MGVNKKHLIGYAATAIVALGLGSATSSTAEVVPTPLPAVTVNVPGPERIVDVPGPVRTVTVPGPVRTVTKQVPAPVVEAPVEDAVPEGSSCDRAREAILTGSNSGIASGMRALVADRSAPSIAREYARYYLGRDSKDKDMREMDVMLIQSACSV